MQDNGLKNSTQGDNHNKPFCKQLRHINMQKVLDIFVFITVLTGSLLFAQRRQIVGTGSVKGRVIESLSEEPVELANVILYDIDHKQVSGTATNENGQFYLAGIKTGDFTIEISFIGLKTEIRKISSTEQNPNIDLGIIRLEQKPIFVEGEEVVAERPAIEFKIDKKVINVKESYTGQSGTAVDVLENVPSISVDVEGNVSLRGSTNFRVLVDNRPTILEASEALQQIPASTIDRIEIITNPSARYDPEGLTGIINVITKRPKQAGMNGIANLSWGIDSKYSGDFLLNYQHNKIRTFFGLDYNNLCFPGTNQGTRETITPDTAYYSITNGNETWFRRFQGVKTGMEYLLKPGNKIGVSFELRKRRMNRNSDTEYNKWSIPGDTTIFLSIHQLLRGGYFYSFNADYLHDFEKNKKLTGGLTVNYNNRTDESVSEMHNTDSTIASGWKSRGIEPAKRLLANFDYAQPCNLVGMRNGKLEAGYQFTLNCASGNQYVYVYDTIIKDYNIIPEYTSRVDFTHNIFSLYTMHSGEFGKFSYQSGLRGEYTYRQIQATDNIEKVNIRRIDLFPTIHISYKLLPTDQIMASYTRRVNRPRNFELQPFAFWRDPYSLSRGNPGLLPEFVDACELSYQKQFGNIIFAVDGYYRVTSNKIENITVVYSGEIMLFTVDNVGKDYAYGIQPTLDLSPLKWLNINFSADFYDHYLEGIINDRPYTQKGRTWSLRNSNTFRIGRGTRLQISGTYSGPEIMAQGERTSFLLLNAGIRQEIIPRVLNLTAQVRDILSTGKFESTTSGENFQIHNVFERKSPVIILGLSYNFNNYKAEPKKVQGEDEFEQMENF